MSGPARVTAIVPARDSAHILAATVTRLAAALDPAPPSGGSDAGARGEGGEILIVENGSADETWALAQRLVDVHGPVPIRAVRSAVGLGHAYAEGLRRARGEVALLTADDLPFGLSDLRAWRRAGRPAGVVVGSKAHHDSRVPRPWVRRAMTATFEQLRRGLLDLRVGDTQGTLFVPVDWGRRMLPTLVEGGYLFPTELIYVALAQGLPVTEIPVVLEESHAHTPTRIRARDIVQMTTGLLTMRRRRARLGTDDGWTPVTAER